MPLLNVYERELQRATFRTEIHNLSTSVRTLIGAVVSTPDPEYINVSTPTRKEFPGFLHSYYHILSGKISRLFRSETELKELPIGLLDKIQHIVQYVPDDYVLLSASGLADGPASATLLADAAVDFVASAVQVGAKVLNVTDGSSATVTVVAANLITTTPLSGGTLNLYSLGDSYQVLNINKLVLDDQILLRGDWRTVLMVIPDSEGVQTTVLCSD